MSPRVPRLGWEDPFRALDMLTSMWSSTGLPSVGVGAVVPYRSVFTTLQRLLVGREIRARVGDQDVTLVITEFDSPLDPRGLAVGQLGEIRLAARDMRFGDHRFERATAVLRNVHIRPGVPPWLVAAPVELSLALPPDAVDTVLRSVAPRLRGELRADGTAALHWARRPTLGSLEVDVQPVGSALWLTPRALVARRKRWALSRRVPGYPVRLPDLPRGLLVTGVAFGEDSLQLSGLLPEWRIELPLKNLEEIISYLSQRTGALDLAWPSLRRRSE
ncbi:hypothetical protein OQ968_00295 [Mycobacterium sp. 663a-19]|uniref:hypothetical protein n=1 Tax=Mycobacterium sp. 663a-19 TaxID=2986148 RepID=UPI002D1F307C|nr:hypothetical protein [Mycobacterium sp. 663a-19]MEB3979703.1 hypothetical protein [Mycobacterium sp. 663a-19]